jgi:hypothetical protein
MLTTITDLKNPDVASMVMRARKISSRYDDFITKSRGKDRLPGIHASEVHGCKRKIVYSLLAYPPKENLAKGWRQRFQVGHAVHDMLQTDFENMAKASGGLLEFQREALVTPETNALAQKWFVNSACDGIFTEYDCPGGDPVLRYGLEIKTEAMDGFDKLKAPKESHIWQAHVYMACLDLPAFWFLYMNKNNQNTTGSEGEFFVLWDPKVWATLEARFAECHDFAERFVFPEREESMLCQFCGFSYTCQPPSLTRASMPQPGRPWAAK